ncbi:MAG: glycoside hydrolase [Flavobacteriales bacterium]|nr:MAG: glycoside hydrolase [Flavobacteriales bacterium]
MKKISVLFILILLTSCSTRRSASSYKSNSLIHKVVRTAEQYKGAPYRFGGHSKRGMDCSGLIYQSFLQHQISFPRISHQQAKKGKKINKRNIRKGDLVFFATSKSGKVSHVGLVHHIKKGEVFFIHASSSKGVIVSSLNNPYWKRKYLFARRVL